MGLRLGDTSYQGMAMELYMVCPEPKPLIRDQMMVSVSPAFMCTVSLGQERNQLLF
jgi:hypothetical protein